MVLDTLDDFCKASGLCVNFDKSRVLCTKNVSRHRRENFTSISSIHFAMNLGKYLGVPLVEARVTKFMFYRVLKKIQGRLASWKGKLLNLLDVFVLLSQSWPLFLFIPCNRVVP